MYRLRDYRRTVKPVLEHFASQDQFPPLEKISLAVQMTQVPLLCVAAIYREVYGPSEILDDFIQKLKDFYQADFDTTEETLSLNKRS